MRTKTLLIAAAIGAAGIASSMAQPVYSVNAVGYVNVSFPSGFRMFSNPLRSASDNLSALIPVAPDGSQVYKFTPTGYQIRTFDEIEGGWTPDGNLTIPNGGGAWLRNSGAPFSQTFVGEVPEGNPLMNPLVSGFQQVSSQVPQTGLVSTTLLLPGSDGDQLYKYVNPTGYLIFTFDEIEGGWTPSEPTIDVGDAFFLRRGAAGSWNRAFDVTP